MYNLSIIELYEISVLEVDGQMIPMDLERQILLVVIGYLLSFIYIRGFISGEKDYQLNTSAIKKETRDRLSKSGFYTADIVKRFLKYCLSYISL